jgi:hypothetical protein
MRQNLNCRFDPRERWWIDRSTVENIDIYLKLSKADSHSDSDNRSMWYRKSNNHPPTWFTKPIRRDKWLVVVIADSIWTIYFWWYDLLLEDQEIRRNKLKFSVWFEHTEADQLNRNPRSTVLPARPTKSLFEIQRFCRSDQMYFQPHSQYQIARSLPNESKVVTANIHCGRSQMIDFLDCSRNIRILYKTVKKFQQSHERKSNSGKISLRWRTWRKVQKTCVWWWNVLFLSRWQMSRLIKCKTLNHWPFRSRRESQRCPLSTNGNLQWETKFRSTFRRPSLLRPLHQVFVPLKLSARIEWILGLILMRDVP